MANNCSAQQCNNGIYAFKVKDGSDNEINLTEFEGRVLLIVNTATQCGFTPQYAPLEAMYEKYKDKGFEILDFPCNQFGHQAPGSYDDIHNFCELNYKTKFRQFAKIDVNGKNELPLYTYLKDQKGFKGFGSGKMADVLDGMLSKADPDYAKKSDIKWNFTKFLIDRNGNVIERFEPTADMNDVEKAVEKQLQ